MECKVLILDEPASSLDEQEVRAFCGSCCDLKARGVGISSSHALPRAGLRRLRPHHRSCATASSSAVQDRRLPRVQLVSKVFRQGARRSVSEIQTEGAETRWRTQGSSAGVGLSSAAGVRARSISPSARARSAAAALQAARLRPQQIRPRDLRRGPRVNGTVKMERQAGERSPRRSRPRKARHQLPAQDRKRDGIIGDLSVRDNIILSRPPGARRLFHPISKAKGRSMPRYIRLLSVKTASTVPQPSLSGGNQQQKVILARAAGWQSRLYDPRRYRRAASTSATSFSSCCSAGRRGQSRDIHLVEIRRDVLSAPPRRHACATGRVVEASCGSDLNQSSIMKTIAGGEQA